jgi:hypothetical protein
MHGPACIFWASLTPFSLHSICATACAWTTDTHADDLGELGWVASADVKVIQTPLKVYFSSEYLYKMY